MAAPAPVVTDDAPPLRRRSWFGVEGFKVAAGIALIALILFGQQAYGMATAPWRLDPSLRGSTTPRNVIVVLGFTPERFHSERVQQYGAFAGRDGGLHRIRLRNVTPARLRELSAIPWISRIEPMK